MNIEVGKFYKTRRGSKARIYAIDGYDDGIHGAVSLGVGWKSWEWIKGGTANDAGQHEFDLVSEWVDPVEGKCPKADFSYNPPSTTHMIGEIEEYLNETLLPYLNKKLGAGD